ncbi:MAG: argininosuccinate lyase, partial [Slackia sp.]|nr:argininosuccinate lyase [Slackia sp.]
VLYCEKNGKDLADLSIEELKGASDLFEEDIVSALDIDAIVRARTTYGGTGHDAVKVQMGEAKAALEADRKRISA